MNANSESSAPFKAFEKDGWEAKAGGYDDFFGPITRRAVAPLLDAAAVVGPGVRVLDVATGPGYVAGEANERGASVVGVDIAEAMIALARAQFPGVTFSVGDAEALEFTDQSFDAVVGNFVMLHLERPQRAAAEFSRVLAPGGKLALTVWGMPNEARFLGVILDALEQVGASAPASIPAGPPYFRFSEEAAFRSILEDHLMTDIEIKTISFVQNFLSADALWNGLFDGAVRTPALVRGQSHGLQEMIRRAFDRIVADYKVGDHLALPVSIKLASGRKIADS